MPTYEYLCAKCHKSYELRQGFDAATEHTCEECGKGIAKRVLHAPQVVFKGSGWYVTDSRNKKSAVADSGDTTTPATPATTESAPAPAAASDTSSDTSTAAAS